MTKERFVKNSYIAKVYESDKNLEELSKYCVKLKYVSNLEYNDGTKAVIFEAEESNLETIKGLPFIVSVNKERIGKLLPVEKEVL